MQDSRPDKKPISKPSLSNRNVFCILWTVLFLLYLPAAKAGFVQDFSDWLDQIINHSFKEYVNRSNFWTPSLYQVTQVTSYILYKLFGINPWLWHLFFITLQAANAYLLFVLCSGLMDDTSVGNSRTIAFTGALLFCISPYISEVVVWEPAFHYLQGLFIILLVLVWMQKYIRTANNKYAWWAGIVFLLATHTLEVFYVIPWLVFTMALFYRFSNACDKKKFSKVLLLFFVPELIIFCLHLAEFRTVYGFWVSHIGADPVTAIPSTGLGKPAKYLFHVLFFGRFFPEEIKHSVYTFCDSRTFIIAFYSIVVITLLYIAVRFRSMKSKAQVACLLLIWMYITFVLTLPLRFCDVLLVMYDRYMYVTEPFFYMLVSVLLAFITIQYLRLGILLVYAAASLSFAIQLSIYWGNSYKVIYGLLHTLPDPGNKTIVLLNPPESMHGIPMVESGGDCKYMLMHNLLLPGKQITNRFYDVASYNMVTSNDGAHITVLNDSMIRVTLNQKNSWWWYAGIAAYNYENEDYKLNVVDKNHFYELTLKAPSSKYLLLYQIGDKWKEVDMSRKNADQY